MYASPPRKIPAADISPALRLGGEVRVLLSPGTVAATAGFGGTITIAPGDHMSELYHPYSDKFLYLVSGSVALRVDGAEIAMGPDEALMLRRGERHRIENRGDTPAFFVFHVSPLAPSPEVGHVETEQMPYPDAAPPKIDAAR